MSSTSFPAVIAAALACAATLVCAMEVTPADVRAADPLPSWMQLLEHAKAGDGPRRSMLVPPDDVTRKFAYGPASGSSGGSYPQLTRLSDLLASFYWVRS